MTGWCTHNYSKYCTSCACSFSCWVLWDLQDPNPAVTHQSKPQIENSTRTGQVSFLPQTVGKHLTQITTTSPVVVTASIELRRRCVSTWSFTWHWNDSTTCRLIQLSDIHPENSASVPTIHPHRHPFALPSPTHTPTQAISTSNFISSS